MDSEIYFLDASERSQAVFSLSNFIKIQYILIFDLIIMALFDVSGYKSHAGLRGQILGTGVGHLVDRPNQEFAVPVGVDVSILRVFQSAVRFCFSCDNDMVI